MLSYRNNIKHRTDHEQSVLGNWAHSTGLKINQSNLQVIKAYHLSRKVIFFIKRWNKTNTGGLILCKNTFILYALVMRHIAIWFRNNFSFRRPFFYLNYVTNKRKRQYQQNINLKLFFKVPCCIKFHWFVFNQNRFVHKIRLALLPGFWELWLDSKCIKVVHLCRSYLRVYFLTHYHVTLIICLSVHL